MTTATPLVWPVDRQQQLAAAEYALDTLSLPAFAVTPPPRRHIETIAAYTMAALAVCRWLEQNDVTYRLPPSHLNPMLPHALVVKRQAWVLALVPPDKPPTVAVLRVDHELLNNRTVVLFFGVTGNNANAAVADLPWHYALLASPMGGQGAPLSLQYGGSAALPLTLGGRDPHNKAARHQLVLAAGQSLGLALPLDPLVYVRSQQLPRAALTLHRSGSKRTLSAKSWHQLWRDSPAVTLHGRLSVPRLRQVAALTGVGQRRSYLADWGDLHAPAALIRDHHRV